MPSTANEPRKAVEVHYHHRLDRTIPLIPEVVRGKDAITGDLVQLDPQRYELTNVAGPNGAPVDHLPKLVFVASETFHVLEEAPFPVVGSTFSKLESAEYGPGQIANLIG